MLFAIFNSIKGWIFRNKLFLISIIAFVLIKVMWVAWGCWSIGSHGIVTFGNFINALLSQGVKEALYTDMGQGWNYCFYRINADESSPKYLHNKPLPFASNFVILKLKE